MIGDSLSVSRKLRDSNGTVITDSPFYEDNYVTAAVYRNDKAVPNAVVLSETAEKNACTGKWKVSNSGNYQLILHVNDDHAENNEYVYAFQVENHKPTISGSTQSLHVSRDTVSVPYAEWIHDTDNDILFCEVTVQNADALTDTAFSVVPDNKNQAFLIHTGIAAAEVPLSVTVSDGDSTETRNITLSVLNDAPVVNADGIRSALPEEYTIRVLSGEDKISRGISNAIIFLLGEKHPSEASCILDDYCSDPENMALTYHITKGEKNVSISKQTK